jgi:hypothetical protein
MTSFSPNVHTKDLDLLYGNIHMPKKEINLIPTLKSLGFSYVENTSSGAAKFIKEDLLELEFLTRVIGSGS